MWSLPVQFISFHWPCDVGLERKHNQLAVGANHHCSWAQHGRLHRSGLSIHGRECLNRPPVSTKRPLNSSYWAKYRSLPSHFVLWARSQGTCHLKWKDMLPIHLCLNVTLLHQSLLASVPEIFGIWHDKWTTSDTNIRQHFFFFAWLVPAIRDARWQKPESLFGTKTGVYTVCLLWNVYCSDPLWLLVAVSHRVLMMPPSPSILSFKGFKDFWRTDKEFPGICNIWYTSNKAAPFKTDWTQGQHTSLPHRGNLQLKSEVYTLVP